MEKVKAGIITFHRATNYGAVLQAYALQTKLTSLGVDAEIIDLRNDRVDVVYSHIVPTLFDENKKITIKSLKKCLRDVLHYSENKKKRYLFDCFLKEYMHCSEKVNSTDIKYIEKEYAFFICGSDQVWNLGVINNCGSYFLDFTSGVKKNAYAASFGAINISDLNKQIYKDYLKDFSNISVREKASINSLNELYSGEVKHVLDPTLLLNKEWLKCCRKVSEVDGLKYILFYELYDMKNTKLHSIVSKLGKITGYKIVHIGKNRFFTGENIINVFPAPDQWIWLFLNSQYIVTNSFHGTVFSINFQKPFLTALLIPDKRPANIRMIDILNELGLEDRVIDYDIEFDESLIKKEISWDEVNLKLEEKRTESINYLKKIVEQYN